MARLAEHARAAAVAVEEQSAGGGIFFLLGLEEKIQVLVGGGGVAHVELNCLAGADEIGDADAAAGLFHAEDVADEEVAARPGLAIFVDGGADVEAVVKELLIVVRHAIDDFLDDWDRG